MEKGGVDVSWETLDPLAYYRETLEPTHRTAVAKAFDALLARSGVSLAENRAAVARLRALEESHARAEGRVGLLSALNVTVALLFFVCGGLALLDLFFALNDGTRLFSGEVCGVLGAAALGAGVLWWCLFAPMLRKARQRQRDLATQRKAQFEALWEQVAPFLQSLTWDTVNALLIQSVPKLRLDAYLPEERLRSFQERFGSLGELLGDRSVVALQSGTIAGNPFFIIRVKDVRMAPHRYEGSRTVYWKEKETDSEGNRVTVTRSETLYAYVESEAPEFDLSTFLLYGHAAAPELTFSRNPSKHSGKQGFFGRLRKRRETKALEAFSRNLNDEYGFTIMANREFETLFHAIDRSDESRFRLLFTPLAQRQMVRLLNDETIGYGDDFSFIKGGKTNLILPAHLNDATLDTDPKRFAYYALDEVRRVFCAGIQEDLRHLWFALAPLLTIPLYRTSAPHAAEPPLSPPSSWEHELQANALGAKHFAHPSCTTDCILKAELSSHYGATSEACIRAYGFAGKRRIAHVDVCASNGRSYEVPVPWIEYQAVHHDTTLRCTATSSAHERRHVHTDLHP